MTKSFMDEIGPERAQELVAEAVRKAIEELHAAGLPAIQGDGNGRVYKLYPDGSKVYIEEE
ncbi:hypothetical protein [Embleya sp. NBC_00896]|uniref:hypothetical protein n=1 Tax=Embleya sp. NBC_00896 TaxID=2975961 RepID=UPI002F918887|nr:hypothetical protein OG928_41015 [Embleya sp. NBC_00896]